ncbi:sulfite exporter TauE/SafE family protein [Luteococcus sp. Sow4_B9]|uniref:sulfite exporter TauE/SafE family protein n=1 Tax=Luteococcus sp. Sow4_B9 TaxID=3438792 RepID=UPI003F95A303
MVWWTAPLGLLVGAVMGSLGGGGAIITIPLLVYLLHQDPHAASEGSLVIVGLSSLIGLYPHVRGGRVRWRDGAVFGALGIVGSIVGSAASARMDGQLLLALFSVLLLVVASLMFRTWFRGRGGNDTARPAKPFGHLLLTATGVGMLTGFFGVGGGFAVVPALTLVLGFPISQAIATSLLVIAINCATALASRFTIGLHVDWGIVLPFALAACVGSVTGGWFTRTARPRSLQFAFACLLVVLALWIGGQSITGLLA